MSFKYFQKNGRRVDSNFLTRTLGSRRLAKKVFQVLENTETKADAETTIAAMLKDSESQDRTDVYYTYEKNKSEDDDTFSPAYQLSLTQIQLQGIEIIKRSELQILVDEESQGYLTERYRFKLKGVDAKFDPRDKETLENLKKESQGQAIILKKGRGSRAVYYVFGFGGKYLLSHTGEMPDYSWHWHWQCQKVTLPNIKEILHTFQFQKKCKNLFVDNYLDDDWHKEVIDYFNRNALHINNTQLQADYAQAAKEPRFCKDPHRALSGVLDLSWAHLKTAFEKHYNALRRQSNTFEYLLDKMGSIESEYDEDYERIQAFSDSLVNEVYTRSRNHCLRCETLCELHDFARDELGIENLRGFVGTGNLKHTSQYHLMTTAQPREEIPEIRKLLKTTGLLSQDSFIKALSFPESVNIKTQIERLITMGKLQEVSPKDKRNKKRNQALFDQLSHPESRFAWRMAVKVQVNEKKTALPPAMATRSKKRAGCLNLTQERFIDDVKQQLKAEWLPKLQGKNSILSDLREAIEGCNFSPEKIKAVQNKAADVLKTNKLPPRSRRRKAVKNLYLEFTKLYSYAYDQRLAATSDPMEQENDPFKVLAENVLLVLHGMTGEFKPKTEWVIHALSIFTDPDIGSREKLLKFHHVTKNANLERVSFFKGEPPLEKRIRHLGKYTDILSEDNVNKLNDLLNSMDLTEEHAEISAENQATLKAAAHEAKQAAPSGGYKF